MVRLAVDFECPTREWWENGGQDLWDAITEGFDGSSVILDEEIAESWLSQAEAIDGWDAGPAYAPNPITVSGVEDDDVDLI